MLPHRLGLPGRRPADLLAGQSGGGGLQQPRRRLRRADRRGLPGPDLRRGRVLPHRLGLPGRRPADLLAGQSGGGGLQQPRRRLRRADRRGLPGPDLRRGRVLPHRLGLPGRRPADLLAGQSGGGGLQQPRRRLRRADRRGGRLRFVQPGPRRGPVRRDASGRRDGYAVLAERVLVSPHPRRERLRDHGEVPHPRGRGEGDGHADRHPADREPVQLQPGDRARHLRSAVALFGFGLRHVRLHRRRVQADPRGDLLPRRGPVPGYLGADVRPPGHLRRGRLRGRPGQRPRRPGGFAGLRLYGHLPALIARRPGPVRPG